MKKSRYTDDRTPVTRARPSRPTSRQEEAARYIAVFRGESDNPRAKPSDRVEARKALMLPRPRKPVVARDRHR